MSSIGSCVVQLPSTAPKCVQCLTYNVIAIIVNPIAKEYFDNPYCFHRICDNHIAPLDNFSPFYQNKNDQYVLYYATILTFALQYR